MDEYNSGWDPEIKIYFIKILNSFAWASLWMMAVATAGLFFNLGEINNGIKWYNVLFYLLALVTFLLLIRQLLKIWRPHNKQA